MIKIKVSTPWSHIDFKTRLPQSVNPNYRFYFDDEEEEFDFWIVWGGIKGIKEKVICPIENIIYLTDEVHEQRHFNQHFINQFSSIITCRTDLKHQNIIPTHELNTWMLDRSYDFLSSSNDIIKEKSISVVCSDQTWLVGHKRRYAFVNKLIGHFKDRLDVYGKGFNPIKDKYDALAPYKYSIAIENSSIPGYFTEKIADCYLCHTMPIYAGCPDIEKYFDPQSMLLINTDDFLDSVKKIEALIEEDPYQKLLPLITLQKNTYLELYHIFQKIPTILENYFTTNHKKKLQVIKAESTFKPGARMNYYFEKIQQVLHFPKKYRFQIYFKHTD